MSRRFLTIMLSLFAVTVLESCNKKGSEPAKPATPTDAAREYLVRAGKADMPGMKELIEPSCHGSDLATAAPLITFIIFVIPKEISVTEKSNSDGRAVVAYTVEGVPPANFSVGDGTLVVEGEGSGSVTRSGTLNLVQVGERWLLTCK